jgi:hypothetical protein
MSALTYRIGYAFGTVTREFLRAVTQPSTSQPHHALATGVSSLPESCLSAQRVQELTQVPAIVRAKGVDLNHWYEANTREATTPVRKSRKRSQQAENKPALSSLAELI